MVRQGRGSHEILAQSDHERQFRGSDWYSKPTHRQRYPASGRLAEGILIHLRGSRLPLARDEVP
jgi:hypothetical protein